jgi:hypothetical protein
MQSLGSGNTPEVFRVFRQGATNHQCNSQIDHPTNHQIVYCGFIAKTPKQVEKPRKAFEECYQRIKELVANFASRITNCKIIYESLSDEEVSEYEFLRRMMENLNVKFKQYDLILLQDYKRTKTLNDSEADPNLHIAFPPPTMSLRTW